jgi:hypothetical protein
MTETQINGAHARVALHTELMQAVLNNVRHWVPDVQNGYRLSNGKIADIYFKWMGEQVIIEVKTVLKPSIIQEAISKYYNQCDFLIIAAPPPQFREATFLDPLLWVSPIEKRIGNLWVEGDSVQLHRPPLRLRNSTSRQ